MALHEQCVGATSEWYTPPHVFRALGCSFDVDVASPGQSEKFFAHRNGIALVPDRTSAPWWQEFAPRADLILFVAPKLKFIGADGRPGTSPAQGTCLLAAGRRALEPLYRAQAEGLGVLMSPTDRP
jgi:hypothetical protein